jgi:hypothetical protein
MEGFISLFIGLFLAAVAALIAAFISNYVYVKAKDFYKEDYFQSNYGDRLAYLIKDGHSEKEAYEAIIVERDKEGHDRLFWALFWAGMAVIAALFPNLI